MKSIQMKWCFGFDFLKTSIDIMVLLVLPLNFLKTSIDTMVLLVLLLKVLNAV